MIWRIGGVFAVVLFATLRRFNAEESPCCTCPRWTASTRIMRLAGGTIQCSDCGPLNTVSGSLPRKLDRISTKMTLGTVLNKRALQIQQSNQALSTKEAEQIASHEMLTSMRSKQVDIDSRDSVRAWSRVFPSSNDPL